MRKKLFTSVPTSGIAGTCNSVPISALSIGRTSQVDLFNCQSNAARASSNSGSRSAIEHIEISGKLLCDLFGRCNLNSQASTISIQIDLGNCARSCISSLSSGLDCIQLGDDSSILSSLDVTGISRHSRGFCFAARSSRSYSVLVNSFSAAQNILRCFLNHRISHNMQHIFHIAKAGFILTSCRRSGRRRRPGRGRCRRGRSALHPGRPDRCPHQGGPR